MKFCYKINWITKYFKVIWSNRNSWQKYLTKVRCILPLRYCFESFFESPSSVFGLEHFFEKLFGLMLVVFWRLVCFLYEFLYSDLLPRLFNGSVCVLHDRCVRIFRIYFAFFHCFIIKKVVEVGGFGKMKEQFLEKGNTKERLRWLLGVIQLSFPVNWERIVVENRKRFSDELVVTRLVVLFIYTLDSGPLVIDESYQMRDQLMIIFDFVPGIIEIMLYKFVKNLINL